MMNQPLTILFADDDSEDREHLQETFQAVDPTVNLVLVRNGAEVMDYLAARTAGDYPALVILDFNMPLVNGLEVLVKMSKEPKYNDIPRVIYSTSDSPFHFDLCKQAGAKKYFVKPNQKKDLEPIVKEMVSLATAGQPG